MKRHKVTNKKQSASTSVPHYTVVYKPPTAEEKLKAEQALRAEMKAGCKKYIGIPCKTLDEKINKALFLIDLTDFLIVEIERKRYLTSYGEAWMVTVGFLDDQKFRLMVDVDQLKKGAPTHFDYSRKFCVLIESMVVETGYDFDVEVQAV